MPHNERGLGGPLGLADTDTLGTEPQDRDFFCSAGKCVWIGLDELQPEDRAHGTPHHLGVVRVYAEISEHDATSAEGLGRSKERPRVPRIVQIGEHQTQWRFEDVIERGILQRRYAYQARRRLEIGYFFHGAIVDNMNRGSISIEVAYVRVMRVHGLGAKNLEDFNRATECFLK